MLTHSADLFQSMRQVVYMMQTVPLVWLALNENAAIHVTVESMLFVPSLITDLSVPVPWVMKAIHRLHVLPPDVQVTHSVQMTVHATMVTA